MITKPRRAGHPSYAVAERYAVIDLDGDLTFWRRTLRGEFVINTAPILITLNHRSRPIRTVAGSCTEKRREEVGHDHAHCRSDMR